MNWLRIRELIRKEFIQLFRDKKSRPVLTIMPIVQLLIFGYVLIYDIKDIRVAFFDQSKTRESRMLADAFDANPIFRITHFSDNPREPEKLLLEGKVDIVVKVGPDLSRRIRQGKTADIQILLDGSTSNMAYIRMAYTSAVLERVNQMFIKELYPSYMHYGKIDARIRTWYNPNLDSQYFFVPGIVAFVVMFLSLVLTSMAIIRERESGTMEQLIVTPLRPIELITGKTIPYAIVSFVQMFVVGLIAIFWFNVPMNGSILLICFGTCLFLLSSLGMGLLISTVSATQQQATITTFFVMVPALILSGFIFPVESMPIVVQWITYLNPLRFFLVIVRGIFLKGVGMEALWHQYVALTVLGVVLFTGAITRFRKQID
jgi:ABC-2 type transport system permease protein